MKISTLISWNGNDGMGIIRKSILVLLLIIGPFVCLRPTVGFAYLEDYPPFQKAEQKSKTIPVKELPNEFQDGDLSVKTYEGYPDSARPFVTDVSFKGKLIWSSKSEEEKGFDRTYYEGLADLNGDGLKDVIVVSGPAAPNSLAAYIDFITIILRNEKKAPDVLQYETMSFDAKQDIPDLNGDGKAEFLKCDLVQDIEAVDKKEHSFWLYTIYELKGNQLVMNNSLRKGFPKFIQYKNEPNEKPTNKISDETQKQYVLSKMPQMIISKAMDAKKN